MNTKVRTRGPGGQHLPVLWFGRRPPRGRIAPPTIGAPWDRAGTRRAPHLRGCVPRTGWRPPGSGRWRGALSCPAPAPRSLLAEDRESGLLFSPKDKLAWESPHRPAARKTDVNGDASLTSERQGQWAVGGDPDPSGARHSAPAPGWAAESVARRGAARRVRSELS